MLLRSHSLVACRSRACLTQFDYTFPTLERGTSYRSPRLRGVAFEQRLELALSCTFQYLTPPASSITSLPKYVRVSGGCHYGILAYRFSASAAELVTCLTSYNPQPATVLQLFTRLFLVFCFLFCPT
ncbi:uncharacterized protein YALI1_F38864g [Yarrowia lipolytica]|uniref:Uncharacterized protein n=1 Tax=Yarrowia lipolytica TaxID=4952 RepID=A0A1D8NQN3_YARLL|nr:hypothetical protein YALI1_F38864g [Yarrowia lipolytica]